jgi:hypothetical protein
MAAPPPTALINETRVTRNRSKTSKSSSPTPWTPAEDQILLAHVQDTPEFNWRPIYEMIPTRDPKQIIERWSRVVNPALKKGSWSSAEDAIIRQFVGDNGPNNWTKCAVLLPGRNGKQCRERWMNSLDPDLVLAPFTEEEDRTIVAFHAQYGNKWEKIAATVRGRSANAIKNRWHFVQRKMRKIGQLAGQENVRPPSNSGE